MDKGHLVDVKVSIRAFLISTQDSLTIQDLEKDFKSFTGQPLPFLSLGFNSAEQFLRSIPDVVTVVGYGPQAILKYVPSVKTEHIADFVKHQKPIVNKKRRNCFVRQKEQKPSRIMKMVEKSPEEICLERLSITDSKVSNPIPHFNNNMEQKSVQCSSQIKQVITEPGNENQKQRASVKMHQKLDTAYNNKQLESPTIAGRNVLINKRFNIILNSSDEEYVTQQKETIKPDKLNSKLSALKDFSESELKAKTRLMQLEPHFNPIKGHKSTNVEAVPENAMTDIINNFGKKEYEIKKEQCIQEHLKIPQCTLYDELKKGSLISLYISEIRSPLIFFFHINEENHELIKLEHRMQETYSILPPNDDSFSAANLKPGEFCAAKNGDTWHRAKILSMPTYLNDFSKIKVLFVDYGWVNQVSIRHIKRLASEYFKIPVQAAQGHLSGIKFNVLASSIETSAFFVSIANDRCLYAYVSEIDKNISSLGLILVDTNSEPIRNINELLIRKGFVDKTIISKK